jgi:hypothetical protein
MSFRRCANLRNSFGANQDRQQANNPQRAEGSLFVAGMIIGTRLRMAVRVQVGENNTAGQPLRAGLRVSNVPPDY